MVRSPPFITKELMAAEADAVVAEVIRVFFAAVTAFCTNSSVGLSGRRPVLAFQVTKVLAMPVAVPVPPEVAVDSPTRKETILVSCAAALIPVSKALVVPKRVGAEVIFRRATLAVDAVSMPRLVPLTKNEPGAVRESTFPRLAPVSVAVFVPPKATVSVPDPTLIAPTVSDEFVAA